ncbi:HNH endonuclease [Streptomyces sp. NPDC058653]|uniref:HNH endonuclease n=1 Tax=Streptomyces sp. NPDC058653 TaxID=3346576 RepID=UPI0036494E93
MLCSRVDGGEARGKDKNCRQGEVRRRVRSSAAREAVLLRCRGRCENPECLLPDLPYRTSSGGRLLEVDHIDDHVGGGRDHPAAMIALCPNCHSNKTRGAGRAVLAEQLRKVAADLHASWVAPPSWSAVVRPWAEEHLLERA